jgi:hypothetical protein
MIPAVAGSILLTSLSTRGLIKLFRTEIQAL